MNRRINGLFKISPLLFALILGFTSQPAHAQYSGYAFHGGPQQMSVAQQQQYAAWMQQQAMAQNGFMGNCRRHKHKHHNWGNGFMNGMGFNNGYGYGNYGNYGYGNGYGYGNNGYGYGNGMYGYGGAGLINSLRRFF